MLDHLDAMQGALPLLQFAATRLWDARDPSRKLLTQQAYDAMGGITGALANHADSVLEKLSSAERLLARDVFQHLVTPERTRALLPVEELTCLSKDPQLVQRLVDHLVQARLLVIHTGNEGASVELVHESLLHAWPTLRRWLDEGQEDAGFLEQLRQAARQWQAKGRHHDLLWHGELVEEARRFQRRYRGELPATQRDFLAAVFAQAERATRRKRGLMAAGVTFLILLVAASAVALVVIRNAQHEAERQAVEARRAEDVARQAADKARVAAEQARRAKEDERLAKEEERLAKEEAQRNLAEVEAKELKLQKALRQNKADQEDLREKNEALQAAYRKAKLAEERAFAAVRKARDAEDKARQARENEAQLKRAAEKKAKELEEQLERFIKHM
jgi:hypothetical protein